MVTNCNGAPTPQYIQMIKSAVAGGVTSVQLRNKYSNFEHGYKLALTLKSILTPLNIPLIINDSIELAKAIDADGLHLGQTDGCPDIARKQLGPNKIIGLSIETMDELENANTLDSIDYIGASAIFPSSTKLNCKTIWGLDGLAKISQQSKHPVVAIGGINASNSRQVFAHGAQGIAVVCAIHQAKDHKQAAIDLLNF